MTIEEYINLREAGKQVTSKMFTTTKREQILYAAKKLDFLDEEDKQKIVMEDDSDFDVLTDYVIYSKGKKGECVLDDFYESDIELTDEEEDYLDGMINNYASLFVVKETEPENSIVVLMDVLAEGTKEYRLMDINLSETASLNMLFFTRLLELDDAYITSGVSFYFEESYKLKVINDIKSFKFRKRRKLTNNDLFLLCLKKSKQYGGNIATIDFE